MQHDHGSVSTYTNYKCRCDLCRVAHSTYIGMLRERRYATRILVAGRLVAPAYVAHGTSNAYLNWGCRCWPCTDAHSDTMRSRRRARRGGQQ
jgi:hypothetical protein